MSKEHLYVVLTRTNTIISRLIHLFTQDEYTHAALALDRELTEMYSFARKYTYYPFLGRFKHERLDEGIYKLAKQLPGVVLELEVEAEQYEKARRLVQSFKDNSARYKYNCRGLVYGLLHRPTKRDDRFLCSQFVYHVLHSSGIADFQVPANLVKPVDFLKLPGRIVFQGDLKQLVEGDTSSRGGLRFYRRLLPKWWAGRAS
ncbi:MAG TPA: hypothetical protein PLZ65_09855 [Limnochordia bacterium]|nr:hypothetical protein [Limnochordia bacterium]